MSRRFVGAYNQGSMSERARARRWEMLRTTFPDISEMKVLDIGGDARAWLLSPIRPAHVTLLNIVPQATDEPWMSSVVGDACDLPTGLPAADLVYSNSVIEHVGGHWRRQRYAQGIRDAADRYWVQTPYRYFPIEPHFLVPGLQYLPLAVQASVITRWPVGNYSTVTERGDALQHAMNIELLSEAGVRSYFPDAEIVRERFAGAVKSLVAVRR